MIVIWMTHFLTLIMFYIIEKLADKGFGDIKAWSQTLITLGIISLLTVIAGGLAESLNFLWDLIRGIVFLVKTIR